MSDTRRITYPISPDYIEGRWTVERALAEVVANALDEDAQPKLSCKNGVFTVEDKGDGLRSRDLVLGISKKSSSQIGQFGEGLKVASLVLARSRKIKSITIETVGFTLRPLISKEAFHALGDDDPVELLAFDITPNTREKGTKVMVAGVDETLAQKVNDRFLALTDPAYRAPKLSGRVLFDRPGALYICGVFVQQGKGFCFGYDIADKTMQNRDRSVVDSWRLRASISEILDEALDGPDAKQMLRRLVDQALHGKLADEEASFLRSGNPKFKTLMRQIGEELYAGQQVVFQDPRNPDFETVLDLQDNGFTVVSCNLGPHETIALFRALGVQTVKSQRKRQQERRVITEWIKRDKLAENERANLETAVALVKRLYGDDSVGRVDAYETTRYDDVDTALHFGGFYQPAGGLIGIQRQNLASLEQTLDVLIHESAHRITHHKGGQYADRTRDFEWQLGRMAATLAVKLHALGVLDEENAEVMAALPSGAVPVKPRYESDTPSGSARKLVAFQLDRLKITSKQMARETGMPQYMVKRMRSDCGSSLHSVPTIAELEPLCDKLSLDVHAIWLAMFSSKLCDAKRTKAGKLYGKERQQDFEASIAVVEQRGPEWAELAAELRAQLAGTTPTPSNLATDPTRQRFVLNDELQPRGDEEWLTPYNQLLEVERERVGVAGTLELVAASTV